MPGGRKKAGKKRVAAYARISCVKDAMLHSLSAQVSYFSNLIQRNPEWIFAGIYADEVTGTTKERKDFQRRLADCRNGQIDMIIVKSLSRFARNMWAICDCRKRLLPIICKRSNCPTVASCRNIWYMMSINRLLTGRPLMQYSV